MYVVYITLFGFHQERKDMSEKRKDNKGRILRDNERQRKDGSYEYRYIGTDGKKHSVYSWRLVTTDKTPKGKRDKAALRDLIKQIEKDLSDGIATKGGNMTVVELCEQYLLTQTGIKPTTEAGHKTVMNILKKHPFGQRRIDTIKMIDAKLFLLSLQKEDGRSYSSVHSIRGVLRPAFRMAYEDDYIRKNPFDWQLSTVLVDDSHTREAISRDQERKFLKFIKEDEYFAQYYDAIYILFNTGLRISEFCGLTLQDVDLDNQVVHINHQLQRKSDGTLYCDSTKTKNGVRSFPLVNKELYECFERAVTNRIQPKTEPMVDGYCGFVWLNDRSRKGLRPMVAMDWEHIFKRILDKYNDIYRVPLPKITPHVCRHTFCTNRANENMGIKQLQYLMGHSDISVTMDTYTHVQHEAAREELLRLEEQGKTKTKTVQFA